ncbi:Short-chain dehydrogenase/reductase family protein [Mycena kentingensis (nom. inval.)]|nr:Short-chain dehydrogenase/reductase family protein [Mycena kentingensis (nom. inval.)]
MASLPTFGFSTPAEEVTSTFSADIAGKNVIVTGASLHGIGYATARAIAREAALVIVTGYNAERLKLSAEGLRAEEGTKAQIRTLTLDLTSYASVRRAAAEVNAYPEPLHVLINNAADSSGVYRITEDGHDAQMQTDYFGPWLFTKLLVPKLLKSAQGTDFVPRVVVVSSGAYRFVEGINYATLRRPESKPAVMMRYAETKTAGILFAAELARRAGGKLLAFSLHPGIIFTNTHMKDAMQDSMKQIGVLKADGSKNPETPWKTLSQGAATTVVAAFDSRIADKSGAFLEDCNDASDTLTPYCSDPENGKKLWKATEEIVGEVFNVEI